MLQCSHAPYPSDHLARRRELGGMCHTHAATCAETVTCRGSEPTLPVLRRPSACISEPS